MPDQILPQRKRPLRMYAEAYATAKPLPTHRRDYALALEEFGEGLVAGYERLLATSEKTMSEMVSLSTMPLTFSRKDALDG